MSLSMYQASVPVFIRALGNLASILKKAAAHADQHKIDPAVLLASRLYPNMFPLSKQIQIATDMAKGAVARLAGVDRPVHADTETSFDEFDKRIESTLAFLNSIKPEQIDGSEEKSITLTMHGKDFPFVGQPYLLHYAIPNVFFHTTTAYDILRHNGVELSKQDFIGGI